MEDKVKNILEESMKDIVLDAVKKVDIQGIMQKEIESTVRSIAHDIFREYGDFGKELQEKLKKEMSFNVSTISVPNFGSIAVDTVSAELSKFEHEEADKIRKSTEQRLKAFLGKYDEKVTLKEIEDLFGAFVYEEYLKDDCSCEMRDFNPEYFDNVREFLEYNSDYSEIKLIMHERETTWSSISNTYITHLNMSYEGKDLTNSFDDKSKERYSISLHIGRQRNKDEKYEDDKQCWLYKKDNHYSIIGMEINGQSIERERGTLMLDRLVNPHEQLLASVFMNNRLIDASSLSNFEIEQE